MRASLWGRAGEEEAGALRRKSRWRTGQAESDDVRLDWIGARGSSRCPDIASAAETSEWWEGESNPVLRVS